MKRTIHTIAAAAMFAGGAWAQDSGPLVRARLTSEQAALSPGRTATLGIVLDIEKGWHVYWNGKNDSGYEPQIKLSGPDGYQFGSVQWPTPTRYLSPGEILDHVYEERVVLLVPVRVPDDASGAARFEADLNWLVCRSVCVMEETTVNLELPVASSDSPASASRDAGLIQEARRRTPRPLPKERSKEPILRIWWQDGNVRVEAKDAAHLAFYPEKECSDLLDPIRSAESKDGRLDLRLVREDSRPLRLRGIVEYRMGESEPVSYRVDLREGESPLSPEAGR